VRVHQDLLERQKLPQKTELRKFGSRRFEEINNFEKYLVNNGVIVLKFFLNVSKGEQKKRFLERIDSPRKKLEVFRK
jgi:polyphosphate kinase 2 (PPK2 family)